MVEFNVEYEPKRRASVLQHERDGELLLYLDKNEPGVILNASARAIWELCDGTRSVRTISRELERRFTLPEGVLLADVRSAVQNLAQNQMVEPANVPSGSSVDRVDWSRVVHPCEDLSDTDTAIALFAARNGRPSMRTAPPSKRTLCEGRLSVEYGYAKHSEELVDAPLDHPNIARAEDYLRRWPLGYRFVQKLMHSFHPLLIPDAPDGQAGFLQRSYCHSSEAPSMFGTMWSTVNCPFMLAENFVHEAAHQKLFGLGIFKESCLRLITNAPNELYRSPVITDRGRPMTAVVHGVYSYLYVTAFDIKYIESEPSVESEFRERLATNVGRIEQGIDEIRRHVRVDAAGERFFRAMGSWTDALILRGNELSARRPRAARTNDAHVAAAPAVRTPAVHAPTVHAPEPVRVFVGTDPRQTKANIALEHSIRKHTRGDVEIVWMDYGRGGPWGGWEIGRKRGDVREEPGPGWATEFSAYRFAIPEVAGFRGRAIYLDSDMLVLRDLRELFEQPMKKPWLMTPNCGATMLIDCAYFEGKSYWPRLEAMKRSGWNLGHYMEILKKEDVLGTLSPRWNCHDGKGYSPSETGVLHFTSRRSQPWMPYPEVFHYVPHPREDLQALWWETYLEAMRDPKRAAAYGRGSPSPRYRELVAQYRQLHLQGGDTAHGQAALLTFWGGSLLPHVAAIGDLVRAHSARTILDYGSGKGWQYCDVDATSDVVREQLTKALRRVKSSATSIPQYWGVDRPMCYDPAYPPFASLPAAKFDGVVCTDVLEHCPEPDLEWVVREIFAHARKFVFANVADVAAQRKLPNGENAHCTVRPEAWWREKIGAIAREFPGVQCELRIGLVAAEPALAPR